MSRGKLPHTRINTYTEVRFAERMIHPRFASQSRISGKMQGSTHQEGQLIDLSPT